MGKTDNIKRAKRLKEAKRQREQDVLMASGQEPAAKVLKNRIEQKGGKVLLNQGPVKYSELLKSFVNEILLYDDTSDKVKLKYMFGIHAWNCAIIKETSEETYLKAKNEFADVFSKMSEAEILFDELVELKQNKFLEYKDVIVDFEIKKIRGNDYNLTVATSPYDAVKR